MVVGGTGATVVVAVPLVGLAVVQAGSCRSAVAPHVREQAEPLGVVPTGLPPVLGVLAGPQVGPTAAVVPTAVAPVKVVAPRAPGTHSVPENWGRLVGCPQESGRDRSKGAARDLTSSPTRFCRVRHTPSRRSGNPRVVALGGCGE
jgi:hypothetical protein